MVFSLAERVKMQQRAERALILPTLMSFILLSPLSSGCEKRGMKEALVNRFRNPSAERRNVFQFEFTVVAPFHLVTDFFEFLSLPFPEPHIQSSSYGK